MKSWRSQERTDNQEGGPPRVTATQWILAAVPVVIAAIAYDTTSYNVLAILAQVLGVMSLALLIVVAKEALRTRAIGKAFLIGGTFLFYWAEALALSFQPEPFTIPAGFPISEAQFEPELITLAFVYVSVFQLLLLVGYSIRPRLERVVRSLTSRLDSLSFDRWILVLLLATCSVLPLFVYYDFDVARIINALLASRSSVDFEAPEPGLAQNLALFGIYGAALFFVYALKTNTWRRFWWLFLGVIVALPFVTGGTRHIWLYISLPSVLVVLRGFKGQLDSRRYVGFAAAGLVVLAVAQMQFAYRSVGWSEVGNAPAEELSQLNNNGQLTALLYAEHLVPREHAYFMEPAEPYFLIHWIPRQLWPSKPVMESWAFYNESYVQGAGFNVTPSVIGQFHLNWGLSGVIFIGAWLGLLTCIADRILLRLDSDRQRAMFVAVGMFYAFIISSFRIYSPIYFSYLLFGLVAMLLLTHRTRLSRAFGGLTSRLPTEVHPSPLIRDPQLF
jgi:oligosaccharide repeat unit polymerase